MPLIKCHECGHDVSTEAAGCPHCGAKPRMPSREQPRWINRFAMVAVAAVALIATVMHFSSPDPISREDETRRCKSNLQCWGERGISTADAYCKDPVERMAVHSVRWTDTGAFETKFSHFRWKDQAAGLITFIGDRAEFQNGFGAYTPVTYECDLDQETKAVLDVRVTEGRLP